MITILKIKRHDWYSPKLSNQSPPHTTNCDDTNNHQVETGIQDNLVFRLSYQTSDDDDDNGCRSNSTDSRCSSVDASRRNSKVPPVWLNQPAFYRILGFFPVVKLCVGQHVSSRSHSDLINSFCFWICRKNTVKLMFLQVSICSMPPLCLGPKSPHLGKATVAAGPDIQFDSSCNTPDIQADSNTSEALDLFPDQNSSDAAAAVLDVKSSGNSSHPSSKMSAKGLRNSFRKLVKPLVKKRTSEVDELEAEGGSEESLLSRVGSSRFACFALCGQTREKSGH